MQIWLCMLWSDCANGVEGQRHWKKQREFQLSLEYRPAVDLLRSHYAYLPYFSGKATATAVDLSLALCLFALLTGAKKHHIKQNKTIKQENGKPNKHQSSKKNTQAQTKIQQQTIKLNKDWAILGEWLATLTAFATLPNICFEWLKITLPSLEASSSVIIVIKDIVIGPRSNG